MPTFTSDVNISKPFPAVEYSPTEAGDPTYFEDREINGVMYRTQNATYGGSTWSQVENSKPSFATTQNSDGSISNYTKPVNTTLPWSKWDGNGQRGVFNVRDFGAVGDGVTDDSGKIQKANDAAVAAGGGYVYLPMGNYFIGTAILLGDPIAQNIPITMGGDGSQFTTLIASPSINGGTNIIMVANHQWNSSGSGPFQYNIYIERLGFKGNAQENPPSSSALGIIYIKQVQNCGVRDCNVYDSSHHGIMISGDETPGDWPTSKTINFQVLRNHVNLNEISDVYPGVYPIRVEGANVGLIEDNTIGDNNQPNSPTAGGIYCPGSSHVAILNNYVGSCANAIVANDSTDVIIANNRISASTGYGISTLASTEGGANGVTGLVVSGNVVDGSQNTAVRISAPTAGGAFSSDFSVTGNIIVLGASSTAPYGIHIEASDGCASGNTIDLNGTNATAIAIDSSASNATQYVTATGNVVNNGNTEAATGGGIGFINGGHNISYCVITGNSVFGTANPLVYSSFASLVGCAIRSNPGLNPWAQPTTAQMLVSGTDIHNTYPFDIWVTLTGSVTSVKINGNLSGVTTGSILLPAGSNNTIHVVHSGAAWTWLAY